MSLKENSMSQKIVVVRKEKAEVVAGKAKHKAKVISSMSNKDLAEIVELIAQKLGIADSTGKVL